MCNYTKFSLGLAEVILRLCAMLVLPAHLNQHISWGVFNNLFKLGFKRRVMPRTAMQGLTGKTGNILKRSCENNKSWIKLVIVNLQSSALFWLCAQVPGCTIIKCLGLPPQGFAVFWVLLKVPLENRFALLSELPPSSKFGSLSSRTAKKVLSNATFRRRSSFQIWVYSHWKYERKKIDSEGKYFHSRTEGEGKTIFNWNCFYFSMWSSMGH